MDGTQANGIASSKPPDITRKVTACVACRKQKIKCHMRERGPPCARCEKRGLSCTVNRSLQTILESNGAWKTAVERKIFKLDSALSRVANELRLPPLLDNDDEADDAEVHEHSSQPARSSASTAKGTPHNFEIVMDSESGPAAIPGSIVSPVSKTRETQRQEQDIISRGTIGLKAAQQFLDVYQDRLDHFLYCILGERRTLKQIRSSSALLLAAVSAVGALHLNSVSFDTLFDEFVSAAEAVSFSRNCNLDDIRALCIGAFWLSNISWMCIGAAVRLCAELQLHRSIFKALQGDMQHYLRTRVYYLVYVCDHHFSVTYGRPPMTREDDAISSSRRFLEIELCTQDDARLVSQVQFWVVASEIYQAFGVDIDAPLTSSMIGTLRRLSIKLEKVRADWNEEFTVNQYVGNYPKKGVSLHYHFARLYLCSMAFRGVDQPGFKQAETALDIEEIANTAVLSATTILRTVTSDTEIQSHLNGLPTYFDVMIAFAVVFLIKISSKYTNMVRVDTAEIERMVNDLVAVLQHVTATMHPKHLLVSVAKGTSDLLQQYSNAQSIVPTAAHHPEPLMYAESNNEFGTLWPDISFDEFMAEFDFLADQGPSNGTDLQFH